MNSKQRREKERAFNKKWPGSALLKCQDKPPYTMWHHFDAVFDWCEKVCGEQSTGWDYCYEGNRYYKFVFNKQPHATMFALAFSA